MSQTFPAILVVIGVLLLLSGFLLGTGKIEVGSLKLRKLGAKARPLQLSGILFTLLGFGMYLTGFIPTLTPLLSTSTTISTETFSPPTLTSTNTPTITPAPTSTATPTNTALPPPLVEIFPQVDGGREFVFINNGGELTNNFLPTQTCIHTGAYGLQLIYNMNGAGNGGWGVQWTDSLSKYFDASGFNILTFWVKGASGGEAFQVGMKDTSGKEVKVESKTILVVTSNWTQVRIPVNEFTGVNTGSVANVNLGFNRTHGSGTICIDDIAFVTNP